MVMRIETRRNIISALGLNLLGRSTGVSGHAAAADHRHSSVGQDQLLFSGVGLNMNSTADQALTKYGKFTTFFISLIRCANGSISLTTAQGSLYTLAAKAGVNIMGAVNPFATITGPTTGMDSVIAAVGRVQLAVLTGASIFLSLTTAQGAPATMDMYVYGIPMSEP